MGGPHRQVCIALCVFLTVCVRMCCAFVVWVWVRFLGVSVGMGGPQRQVRAALFVSQFVYVRRYGVRL